MSAMPVEPDSNELDLDAEIARVEALAAEQASKAEQIVIPDADKDPAFIAAEQEAKAAYEAYQTLYAEQRRIKQEVEKDRVALSLKRQEEEKAAKILQDQLMELKFKKEKADTAQKLQDEFATLEARWDLETIGAPWREWAKDHQLTGAKKIVAARNIIVADGMGLGKTLQSLIAMDMVQAATKHASPSSPFLGDMVEVYDYETKGYKTKIVDSVQKPCGRKILYLCPSATVRNVEREVKHWTPLRSPVVLGGMTRKEREFVLTLVKDMPEFFVICNYEAWRKDKALLKSLGELNFDTVILDEAHLLKEVKTNAFRGVKQIIGENRPPYVIPMTGTPILNKAVDFYALLHLIKPDQYYSLNRYLQEFCRQDDKGKWRFRVGGLENLAKRINGNYIRRTKDDAGIQLPPKTIEEHILTLDETTYPLQAQARRQMNQWGSITLDEHNPANINPDTGLPKAISAAAVIAIFTRLRQIETWPAGIEIKDEKTGETKIKFDVEESQKLDYVIRYDDSSSDSRYHEWTGLLTDICPEERTVVFSQFNAPLDELKRRADLAGLRSCVLRGDTSAAEREVIARDFDGKHTKFEDAQYDVVFANYKVGGTGLNMSGATQMIVLDEEWNPGKRDQAYDRIHRLDSTKPVTIHVIRNGATIDDWLANLIAEKEDMIDGFNTANEKSMTELWDDFKNSGLA